LKFNSGAASRHDRRASPLFRETLVCPKKLLPSRAKGLKPFAQIRYGVIDLVCELAPELVSEMTERGGRNELPVFIEHLTVPALIMRKMLLGAALRFRLGPPLSIEEQKTPEIGLLNRAEAYGRT
jgi:hypothetical protein